MAARYEYFPFIKAPKEDHDPLTVMENNHDIEYLSKKFITYQAGNGYRIYNTHEDFLNHLNTMPAKDRSFHEVIFDRPQKLKFDIDAAVDLINIFQPIEEDEEENIVPAADYKIEDNDILNLFDSINIDVEPVVAPVDQTTPAAKYQHIFQVILQTVRDIILTSYGIALSGTDEIICESRDTSDCPKKYSTHIIIDNYYVSGWVQAREITRRVCERLPLTYRQFLDMGVNKRLQNFRIVGCHKRDESRTKELVSAQSPIRTFITKTDYCKLLQDVINPKIRAPITFEISEDDERRVLEICEQAGLLEDHNYKFCSGDKFIFSRIRSSYCDLCEKWHDRDNTLVVRTCQEGNIMNVMRCCRRSPKAVVMGSFHTDNELPDAELFPPGTLKSPSKMEQSMMKLVEQIDSGKALLPRGTLFDTLPEKVLYSELALRPFELTKTLVVHAAMKMGKTKALIAYLDRHFCSKIRPPVIRFISFRQTFSGNIKEKFQDFTLYSDVKGALDMDKLIIQVESLFRMVLSAEPPDLLILDECESIFEQFDSGLLRGNFNDCFAKFQYLMKYSKHVICMDANMSDRTYNILKQMRHPELQNAGHSAPTGLVYHCNQYKNACDDTYYMTADKIKWLGLLYSAVEAGERIAVPMSSRVEADILANNLTRRYPNKSVKLYSGETPASEKREHFTDVNRYWLQFDILIYTPTVSAGVSFEQKHFSKIFGYFTDQSCPVETCIQMLGRIRDVSSHEYYLYLYGAGNNMPTTRDSIIAALCANRLNLFKEFDGTGLHSEYGAHGEVVYHTGDYFQLWVENVRSKNLSRNIFTKLFMHLIVGRGSRIKYLSKELFEEIMAPGKDELMDYLKDIIDQHSSTKEKLNALHCKRVAEAKDLSELEVDDIQNMMMAQKDLTIEQKYAYEKHRLRCDYSYDGVIDEKFVARYKDHRTRRIFKNLNRIIGHESGEEAWRQIQVEERANHKFLMDMGEQAMNQDLSYRYTFDRHRYTLSLVKICGWKSVDDTDFIHRVKLAENLRDNEQIYRDNIGPACSQFGMRVPPIVILTDEQASLTLYLRPINKMLSSMYGSQVTTRKTDPSMFYIRQCSLFATSKEDSNNNRAPMLKTPQATVGQN